MGKNKKGYDKMLIIDGSNLFGTLGMINSNGSYNGSLRLSYPVLLRCLFANKNHAKLYYVSREVKERNQSYCEVLERYGFDFLSPDRPLDRGDKWDDQQIIKILEECGDEIVSVYLVSGDGHFYDSLKKLKNKGKEVKIISIPETTNDDIQREFDFVNLRDLGEDIFYTIKSNRPEKFFDCQIEITGELEEKNISEFNRVFFELSKIILENDTLGFLIKSTVKPKSSS